MALQVHSQGAVSTRPCPLPTEPWDIAKNRFLDGLSDSEKALFRDATLENLFYTASVAQKKYELESKMRKCQQKIKPLLDALQDYGKALDVYANASGMFLCPIWGSVRVLLSIAQAFDRYFETIVRMFCRIGDVLPRFRTYERLFPDHPQLMQALSDAYLEIISFCTEAKRVFTEMKRSSRLLSTTRRALWKGFEGSFETSLTNFRRHDTQVTKHAEVAHMAESKRAQELHKAELALERRRREAEQLQKVLATLSLLDHESQHKRIRRSRHHGTGLWILDHDVFKEWVNRSASSWLCCFGIPGSGKTLLASSVIDAMTQRASTKEVIVYHYCDYADQATLRANAVLGTITKQLLHHLSQEADLPGQEQGASEELINGVEQRFVNRMTLPSTEDLRDLLIRALSCFDKAVLVLDGVDEMLKNDQVTVLNCLIDVMNSTSAARITKIFLTSRSEETYVRRALSVHPYINLSPENVAMDIKVYVEDIVAQKVASHELRFRNPALEQEIVQALVSGAKDMFLWVRLQLEEICEADSDVGIRETLQNLPRDLPDTFIRILKRIVASTGGDRKATLAQKVFRWIVCARRPLTVAELNEAVAISPTDKQLDFERIPNDETYILQACGNLVTYDRTDGTVRFAHHTVQQFLLSPPAAHADYDMNFHVLRQPAEIQIGELCVTYLHFADFETQITKASGASFGATLDPGVVPQRVLDTQTSTTAKATKNLMSMGKSLRAPSSKLKAIRMAVTRTGDSPWDILRHKYSLLNYVVDFWTFHTAKFSAENSRQWSKFIALVLDRQLLFSFRPWEAQRYTDMKTSARLFQYAIDNQQLALLRCLEASDFLQSLRIACSNNVCFATGRLIVDCTCPLAYACRTGLVEVLRFLVSTNGGTFPCDCQDACHLLAAASNPSDEPLDIVTAKLVGYMFDDALLPILLQTFPPAIRRDSIASIVRLLMYSGPTSHIACNSKFAAFIKTNLLSTDDGTGVIVLPLALRCLTYKARHHEISYELCLEGAMLIGDVESLAMVFKQDIPAESISETLLDRLMRQPGIFDMLLHVGADPNRYNKDIYHSVLKCAVFAGNVALVTYLLGPSFENLGIADAARELLSHALMPVRQSCAAMVEVLLSCSELHGALDMADLYWALRTMFQLGRPTADVFIDQISKDIMTFEGYREDFLIEAATNNDRAFFAYLLQYGAWRGIALTLNDGLKDRLLSKPKSKPDLGKFLEEYTDSGGGDGTGLDAWYETESQLTRVGTLVRREEGRSYNFTAEERKRDRELRKSRIVSVFSR